MAYTELKQIIRAQFALDLDGVHGAGHWERVRENGLRLAQATGAKADIVELFAFFHDSRRLNDNRDPEHGERGALYAKSLADSAFKISPADLELLMTACSGHSRGLMTGDVTALTCWDADRLDLGRVGTMPHPSRLCTEAARRLIDWAYRRSLT